MKTVSGRPQLCRAKVIQTVTETPETVLFYMKRQEIISSVFCHVLLCT